MARIESPAAVSASDLSGGNRSMTSCGRAGPLPRAVYPTLPNSGSVTFSSQVRAPWRVVGSTGMPAARAEVRAITIQAVTEVSLSPGRTP
jgi:hypothetical protein